MRNEWLDAAAVTLAAQGDARVASLAATREAFTVYREQVDILEEQLYEAEAARLIREHADLPIVLEPDLERAIAATRRLVEKTDAA